MRRTSFLVSLFALGLLGCGSSDTGLIREEPRTPQEWVKTLRTNNKLIREEAANGLMRDDETIKEACPALLQAWITGDSYCRESVEYVFKHFGAKATPGIVDALQSKDTDVRDAAALFLGKLGPDAKDAVPALIARLGDDDLKGIGTVQMALAKIGEPAVLGLMEATSVRGDPTKEPTARDERIRDAATEALRFIGDKAVPALVHALDSAPDAATKLNALTALWLLGTDAGEAVRPIQSALRDPDSFVRARAAATLKGIGVRAQPAVPALIGVLKDSETRVRLAALEALAVIGVDPQIAIPALMQLVDGKDAAEKTLAVRMLGNLGLSARPALPALTRALEDKDVHVRVEAALALWSVGHQGTGVAPVLIPALQDEEARVRARAAECLGQLGAAAKDALPALRVAAEDKNENVKAAALGALAKIPTTPLPPLSK
jgi:HEAT repeat protein